MQASDGASTEVAPKSPKLLSLSLLTSPHLESGEKESREGQNPNQGIKHRAHQGGRSKKLLLKHMHAITRIRSLDGDCGRACPDSGAATNSGKPVLVACFFLESEVKINYTQIMQQSICKND